MRGSSVFSMLSIFWIMKFTNSSSLRKFSLHSFFPSFVFLQNINYGYFKAPNSNALVTWGEGVYFYWLFFSLFSVILSCLLAGLVMPLLNAMQYLFMKKISRVCGWCCLTLERAHPFSAKQMAWGLTILIQSEAELDGGCIAVLIRHHLTLALTCKSLPFSISNWEVKVFTKAPPPGPGV